MLAINGTGSSTTLAVAANTFSSTTRHCQQSAAQTISVKHSSPLATIFYEQNAASTEYRPKALQVPQLGTSTVSAKHSQHHA
jgi:hypothetical protein